MTTISSVIVTPASQIATVIAMPDRTLTSAVAVRQIAIATATMGVLGPQGPKGDKGDTGAAGANGTNANLVDATTGAIGSVLLDAAPSSGHPIAATKPTTDALTTRMGTAETNIGSNTTAMGKLNHGPANYLVYIDAADANKIKARNGSTGAVDFSGTDAATVINAAIAISDGYHTRIEVAPGHYVLNSPIIIDRGQCTFVGGGFRNITEFYVADGANLTAALIAGNTQNVVGVRIDGIHISGNSANNTTGHGIIMRGNDVYISNCRLYQCPQDGLRLESISPTVTVTDIMVWNVYALQCVRDGFYIDTKVSDSELIQCKSAGTWQVGVVSPIGRYGFYCKGGAIKLSTCHAYFATQHGFFSDQGTANQIISGAYETCALQGILVNQVTNFKVFGPTLYANGTNDMYIVNSTDVLIQGCDFNSGVGKAVGIGTNAKRVIIRDNFMFHNGTGVSIETGASYVTVENNTIKTSVNSVFFDTTATSNNEIRGNYCESPILESSGSADYNRVYNNHMNGAGATITLNGAHSRSWGNATGSASDPTIDYKIGTASKFTVDNTGTLTAGTIPNTAVSGLGTASTQPASAFDAAGAAATAQAASLQKASNLSDVASASTALTNLGGVATGDSRLSDARTPTAHASTHVTGSSDAIQLATDAVDGLMAHADHAQLTANTSKLSTLPSSVTGTPPITVSGAGVVSANYNAANGIPKLDGSGFVPLAQLSGITTAQLSAAAAIVSGQIASVLASVVTGANGLSDSVLSTNVPLLNAANIWTNAKNTANSAPAATANYGLWSLGPLPFDGISTNKYIGNANGTYIAVNANAAGSSSPHLLSYMTAGATRIDIDSFGSVFMFTGGLALSKTTSASTTAATLTVGSGTFSGGNASGTGIGGAYPTGYAGDFLNYMVNAVSKWKVDSVGRHVFAGTAPTAAAGTNAGATPPAPVIAGNDVRGTLTFGTGTSPAAGNEVVVTFATAYSATPVVTLTPANAATAALQLYITSVSTTAFTVACGVVPAASQANTIYSLVYQVLG